ncbi:N-substituted formamide deformylase precursor [Clostridium tepidiprofundi DSM 19306]|uniref:N-substituted formamide deformylase n=1 Tax=Clostridium tepidiprofundi DSM 19306 TaxID=1121338 RepID=A0A151ASG4_9CLOT|nr:amidohydrolase [Clostridium tepidiprofundi]KYH30566.1 N-substituted formamide deformylase precursor [Clostridium tepidiprofundi DSM 19306]
MIAFINGNIITMNNNKIAQAFIVENNVFTYVGSNDEILKIIKDANEIVDLKGKTVIPGINDSHMHFLNYAVTKNNVNIYNVDSIETMISKTKEYIVENNPHKNDWIISRGWNENLFIEKKLPTRYDLDKISCEYPIFFSRVCGHIGVANSKALELTGINSNTPNTEGGIVDKENGIPTGILRENALNLIFNILPPMKKDTIKTLLKNSFEDLLKVGITSIQTEDVTHSRALEPLICAYRELEQENALPVRVNLQLALPDEKSINEATYMNLKTGIGNDKFKIGPIKLFLDGSLGGRTAAMKEEYCDVHSNGVLIYSSHQLNKITLAAYNAGFQIAAHAIGDNAIEQILNSYENIYKLNSKSKLRNIVIHCQFTNNKLIKKFKEIGAIASVQPCFVMSDYTIVKKAVGNARAKDSYAWNDMLKNDIHVAFSSDAPIESFNPFEGIYAAVTRKDITGNPKEGWYKKQCISVYDALKCFTLGSAYASFEENIKGSIENGKLADFVVISDNILKISPDKIKDITVLATYVGGEKKFSVS